MKTYISFCALLVLVIFGCSKSDNGPEEEVEKKSVEADYVALLSNDGLLSPQLLNANGESITLNPQKSSLAQNTIPDLTYIDGSYFLQYHKDGTCGGKIIRHDFKSDANSEVAVFDDLNDCNLMATAIAQLEDTLFIAYTVISSDPDDYIVRIIDLNNTESSPVDVVLDKKPVDLTIAANRLFILALDELITDENSLLVMDLSNNTLIHEMNLGYGARHIFDDIQDNVIVSYDELHTTVNSSTMALEYTQYESDTAPKFSTAESYNLDLSGRLLYPMDPGTNSEFPLVPAIYDFSKKLVTLYAFENFLTEAQYNFEYEIETTTSVNYDEKNGLLLIGYKKKNTASKKGGLLRIVPAINLAVIDNIDLDGVPTEIIIN